MLDASENATISPLSWGTVSLSTNSFPRFFGYAIRRTRSPSANRPAISAVASVDPSEAITTSRSSCG